MQQWPTSSQELLLRAALGPRREASEAWRKWKGANDLERLEPGSFFLLPLLHLNLGRHGVEDEHTGRLRGVYRYAWAKNLMALRGLADVLRRFEKAGIEAVALKGAAIVPFHSPDRGARLMQDVDLLIRERDLPAAYNALADSAWADKTVRPGDALLPFLQAVPLVHPEWPEVDLHWRPWLIDGNPEAERAFFERAQTRPLFGHPVRVPDPTDLLLQACLHGRKLDPQAVARWVADASLLVSGGGIAWEEFPNRAQAAGLIPPIRDSLGYLRGFGLDIPAAVIDALAEAKVEPADEERYRYLMNATRPGRSLKWRIWAYWWRYKAGCRARGLSRSLEGFLRYVRGWCGVQWGVRSWWGIPFAAMRR